MSLDDVCGYIFCVKACVHSGISYQTIRQIKVEYSVKRVIARLPVPVMIVRLSLLRKTIFNPEYYMYTYYVYILCVFVCSLMAV